MNDATNINVLIVGTGEYTTGWVGESATASDKKCGVVGLVMFDLRRRKKVAQRIVLCGTNGSKFPQIREHLKASIEDIYQDMSSRCETVPADDVKSDRHAYLKALETFTAGDVALVFTPDDTHFEIVMACIERGLHVMVTKPIVKSLSQHQQIVAAAKKHNVLVCMEVHKRFDPVYSDARARIARLGDFGFFSSYMSQPKFQLETFRAWAGRSSDISYYLNSHHVDFHCWAMQDLAVPTKVVAMASKGVAKELIGVDCEDTITLQVQWRNRASHNAGSAIYTASWAAAKADVHSQQRFFYLGHKGEVTVDQAHRGSSCHCSRATCRRSLNCAVELLFCRVYDRCRRDGVRQS